MNPRQRRGLMLMILSGVIAVVMFVVISNYVASVESKVGNMVSVYRVTKDLDAYSRLEDENIEKIEVPQRWASQAAQLNESNVKGRVLQVPMQSGSVVTENQLVPSDQLDPEQRELAINVDAVTGIAGRVRPGDNVDVYAVYSDIPDVANQARILLRSIRVVSVGGQQQVSDQDTRDLKEVVPVTLALNSNDALALTYADAFAEQVRLVGLPPSASQDRRDEQDSYQSGDLGKPGKKPEEDSAPGQAPPNDAAGQQGQQKPKAGQAERDVQSAEVPNGAEPGDDQQQEGQ